MSVYCVTGKLGNGKSLVCVGRIRDAFRKGLRVATNLDINLRGMASKHTRNIDLIRIPDKPKIEDLDAIGKGYEGDYDEEKFGLLVLDECGTWFNSRNWQDKDRKAVNDWFLHARKLGWHVYIIIQDISILDSQARDAIAELLVTCRRLDKLRVPFLAPLVKLCIGVNVTFPRIHRAKVTYADGLLFDVWTYRGNDLFSCYDTRQTFLQSYPHGTHSILTPWHTHGRYSVPMTKENIMRITKIYWKRFKSPLSMACGVLLGISAMMLMHTQEIEQNIVRYNLQKNIQHQKPHPVKPEASKTKSSAPVDISAPDLLTGKVSSQSKLSMFADRLRIIGTSTINEIQAYTFSTGEPDKYLTSRDITGMGFAIKPLSDCMAEITIDGQANLIRCL